MLKTIWEHSTPEAKACQKISRADDYLNEAFRESIEDAMAAWQRLKHDAGFGLQGVFLTELFQHQPLEVL